jgi:C-methyltransferase
MGSNSSRPLGTPPPTPPPQAIAMDIATGNWKAQATRAFVTSNLAGVMESCCKNDKFVSVADIAKEAGLDPNATYRLLRYLATFDVCIESVDKKKYFKLGPIGEVLTPNHPQSVAKKICWEASLTSTQTWNKLDEFLPKREATVHNVTGGTDIWTYFAKNPSILSTFQEAMTSYSKEEAFFLANPQLSPTFDTSSFATICDLGAAEGELSFQLANRFPESNYIISDLPECVARIDSSSLPPKITAEAADFFETVPEADAYLLKHIIHAWCDEKAEIILRNIHKANPDATIFVIEFGPMPGPNVPHLSKGFGTYHNIACTHCIYFFFLTFLSFLTINYQPLFCSW